MEAIREASERKRARPESAQGKSFAEFRKDLEHLRGLAREADSAKEQIEWLEGEMNVIRYAALDGMPRASGRKDRICDLIARKDEMMGRWADIAARWIALMDEVDAWIAKLENPDHRTILRLRYIEGCTWEAMPDRSHFSESWNRKLHCKAMLALAKQFKA